MSKDPAFPFYAQDFLTGVMHLTMEERGIYITLLAYEWEHHSIPKKRLKLMTGYEWEELTVDLKNKFKENGGLITNIRLEAEREKRKAFKERQRINGLKGGRPPKNKKPANKKSKNQVVAELYPTFEDFWGLYDKKVGKKDKIEAKWNNLSQQEKENAIAYIPNYKLAQPNKKYRKNPETFLNNESWNDELILENNEPTINGQSESTYRQNLQGWDA
jgi:uncharacterized protein YdaU (DUF1376 family)